MKTKLLGLGLGAAVIISAALWMAGQASAAPACKRVTFEGSEFTACRYEPLRHELRLFAADPSGKAFRGFRQLRAALTKQRPRLAFAMNAGMYDEAGAPIGLYVEDGVERRPISTRDGPGNFHLKPNGVFWLDKRRVAHVTSTDAFLAGGTKPLWASQSGPMLVVDGALHPAIAPNGTSQHVRNGVGASCGQGGGAVFVISERLVSLGRLARLFRDRLDCRNALYFDGTVSSLWVPDQRRMDTGYPLGPMVAVFTKEAQR